MTKHIYKKNRDQFIDIIQCYIFDPFSFSKRASVDDIVSMATKAELDGTHKEEASLWNNNSGLITYNESSVYVIKQY